MNHKATLDAARINIHTQDNRITSHPIFFVQTKVSGRWENKQPFFTYSAARRYIENESHNLSEPQIYVASGYANEEWQAVRAVLLGEVGDLVISEDADKALAVAQAMIELRDAQIADLQNAIDGRDDLEG